MIYSRFGTKLTLVSQGTDDAGQLCIKGTCEGMDGERTYHRHELTADNGHTEIDAAIAKLPPTPKK